MADFGSALLARAMGDAISHAPPRAARLADSGDRLLAVNASVAWVLLDQSTVFARTLSLHSLEIASGRQR
jgi:hypothetical protein